MNNQQDITQLYNSLFKLEQKFKTENAYPIHKRLDFDENFNDIYEYLIAKIDINNKTVLDAGCGVGFGSLLFAKNGAKNVTGISVSNLEIERANANKINIENVVFKVATFDVTQPNSYDLIFCVESLKHSLHFEKSYKTLLNGLKDNGKLIVVDDFFEGKQSKTSKKFMADWNLNFLISESHLQLNDKSFSIESEDITKWITPKSLFKINMQIVFFSIFKRNAMLKKLFKFRYLCKILH